MKSLNFSKKTFVNAVIISAILFVVFWAHMDHGISSGGAQSLLNEKNPLQKVKDVLCFVKLNDDRNYINRTSDQKMIYYVTPTYPRPEQVPELTRLAQTLMHVPRIHWIIADDQPLCSDLVSDILNRSGLPYTHISSPKPPITYISTNFPRGVANRRAALSWLRENVKEGVLYFGDDDNTVDLQLFDEIRQTKKVSMFPVGLIGNYGVSTPIVKDGKVVGFFDSWPGHRKFPVDMAGFAINIEFLNPSAYMPYIAGHEEDRFLVSLGVKLDDIEPLAENCSKILVWHTRTAKYRKPSLKINIEQLDNITKYKNFVSLLKEISRLGMANISPTTGNTPYFIRNRKVYENLGGLL